MHWQHSNLSIFFDIFTHTLLLGMHVQSQRIQWHHKGNNSAAILAYQYQVSLHFSVCLTPLRQLLFITGQAWILIEGINFAVLGDILILIVFLARWIHVIFSGALTTMIVTVQLLFSTRLAWILIKRINLASLTVNSFNAYCILSWIISSQNLQSIENYNGDSAAAVDTG